MSPSITFIEILDRPEETGDMHRVFAMETVWLNGYMDQKGWVGLSACPSLHTVCVYEDGDEDGDVDDPELRVTFPSLVSLEIFGFPFQSLLFVVVANSTMPKLRTLTAQIEEVEEERAEDLLTRLGRESPLLERVDLGELNERLKTGDLGWKNLKTVLR